MASQTAGQLAEARLMAETAMAEQATAEQHATALSEAHQAVSDELARVRAAHDRLLRKAEERDRKSVPSSGSRNRKSQVSSAPEDRKSLAAVPVSLPVVDAEEVPAVPGVSADLAARVVAAIQAEPEADQDRLAVLAGTSDRTVRKVQKALLPAEQGTETDRAAV